MESLPPGLVTFLAVLVTWKAVRDFRSVERQQPLGRAEPPRLVALRNPYDWRKEGE